MPHHSVPSSSNGSGGSSNGSGGGHGNGHANGEIEQCRVCGDSPAKMHYGVLACFGCKGFFRRTLKRPTEYTCRYAGKCLVDRHERNSCRFCRFKKCIEVGMDPKAVRPDRDATGRHFGGRAAARRARAGSGDAAAGGLGASVAEPDSQCDAEWARKLPVEMRTTLMQLMNIELMVTGGDASGESGTSLYPLPIPSLRQLLEDPGVLDARRTEMRYDAFVRVERSELVAVAHRAIIAAVDWVDHLFDLIDAHSLHDKMLLVKNGFSSLMLFTACQATAAARGPFSRDRLHLCNFGYVPRDIGSTYEEPYHLGGRVVPRAIDELVEPLRAIHLKEEEAVLFKAIIILNPQLRGLSQDGAEAVADLRDRIQETLYHVVRETHPKEVASSRFGNILLFLPSVMILGNMICENLSFVNSFGQMVDPLMKDVLAEIEDGDELNGNVMNTEETENRDSSCNGSNGLPHSDSCSSLDSLTSSSAHSVSSNTSSNGSGVQPITYNYSSPSLSSLQQPIPQQQDLMSSPMNAASSLPNLGQIQESDPDYNLTLTPDMFSGMRQAMGVPSTAEQQIAERSRTPPNSPDRPTFYIEAARHKFAVSQATFDRYTGIGVQQSGGYSSPPMMGQPPPQALAKSNSLPQHYAQMCEQGGQQQWSAEGQGGGDSMDYDDCNSPQGYY